MSGWRRYSKAPKEFKAAEISFNLIINDDSSYGSTNKVGGREAIDLYVDNVNEAHSEKEVLKMRRLERRNNEHIEEKLSYTSIPYPFYSYSELKEIGNGGFYDVYKGFRNGTWYAIKVLRSDGDKGDLKSLIREGALGESLSHQNIVKYIGVHIAIRNDKNDQSYILMEYVNGSTLFDIDVDNFSYKRVIMIMLETAKAFKYLHDKDIVHRDAKLQNMMITRKKEIKIIDFGLSCSINSRSDCYCSSSLSGTASYLSREIWMREYIENRAILKIADVYSLGVVFYRLLNKKPLYNRKLSHKEYRAIALDGRRTPRSKSEFPELNSLIDAMTEKDAGRRISMNAVIRNLEKFLANRTK